MSYRPVSQLCRLHESRERELTAPAKVAATAATAPGMTAASTATVTTGGPFFAWPRFVHRERPALKIFLMECLDGLFGILFRGHFHKAEAAGPARKAILHDID